jgi:Concanavalin A-like lectin/glucanases superfamily
MSLAGWFKVGTFDKSWQALVAKGEGNNWRLHRRGGEGGLTFTGGSGGDTPTGADINDGNWHHFAAINDHDGSVHGAAGVYMFMDGQLYAKNDGEANLTANGKRVMIGENPDARNRYWNGEVDDLAIWDRPISATEISSLYANGAGKPLGDLLGAIVGDADKDGMPDEYEVANGFNPNDASDAAKDFDKDGASNLDEYKAGTDPIDVT